MGLTSMFILIIFSVEGSMVIQNKMFLVYLWFVIFYNEQMRYCLYN